MHWRSRLGCFCLVCTLVASLHQLVCGVALPPGSVLVVWRAKFRTECVRSGLYGKIRGQKLACLSAANKTGLISSIRRPGWRRTLALRRTSSRSIRTLRSRSRGSYVRCWGPSWRCSRQRGCSRRQRQYLQLLCPPWKRLTARARQRCVTISGVVQIMWCFAWYV